jgi:hypothetical protein
LTYELEKYTPKDDYERFKIDIKEMKFDEENYIGENKEDTREFTCLFCLYIVKQPISCNNCDNLFCKKCIDEHLKRSKECPQCRTEFIQKPINRLISGILQRLQFYCPLKCKTIISQETMHIHLPKCNNLERLKCLHCNIIMQYDYTLTEEQNYDIHKKDCSLLTVPCLYCEDLVVKTKWVDHLKKCEMNLYYCTQCRDFYPKKFKAAHDEYFCIRNKNFLSLFSEIRNLISIKHFFITESDFI